MLNVHLKRVLFFAIALFALVPLTSVSFTDNALRLALLAMFAGFFSRQFEVQWLKNKIILFAVFYWGVLLFSVAVNPNTLVGLGLTWQRIFEFAPFLLLTVCIRKKYEVNILLNIFLGAMLLADSYYIYQFCTKSVVAGGIIANRPSGFYWQDWFMQIFLLLTLPVSLIRLDYCKENSQYTKVLCIVVLILSIVAGVMSFARGVWLTMLFFFITYAVFRLRERTKLLIAGSVLSIVLICSAMLAFPGFKERMETFTDMKFMSNAHRILAWKSSWSMFIDNPYLGVGQGNWHKNYLEKYIDPNESERLPNAHNNYMQILSETGALGLTTYLALVSSVLVIAFKRFRNAKNNGERAGALIMFFSMMNYLFIGTMGDFKDTRTLSEALWFVIGAGYILSAAEKERGVGDWRKLK